MRENVMIFLRGWWIIGRISPDSGFGGIYHLTLTYKLCFDVVCMHYIVYILNNISISLTLDTTNNDSVSCS